MKQGIVLPGVILIISSLFLAACGSAATIEVPSAVPTTEVTTTFAEPTATLEPIHLKVGYQTLISHAPLVIALEEGLYAEQGLEVELIRFNRAAEMIPALLQGDLDVVAGSTNVTVFNAIAQGGELKFVASKGYVDPAGCLAEGWLARTDLIESGLAMDLSGLRGLRITQNTGSVWEYTLDMMLAMGNLTENDIQITDIPQASTRMEALGSGGIDIASLAEPWVTRTRTLGYGDVFIPLQDLIPGYDLGVLIYGPNLLVDDRDAGQRFMVAYLQAVQLYNQGKTDRNIEIISQYTELSSDDIRQSCWTSFRADGQIDPEGLLGFEQWAVEKGHLLELLPAEKFWDPFFVEFADNYLK